VATTVDGTRETVSARRSDLVQLTVAETITARGKELSADDTVGEARRLFRSRGVHVLPVLDGTAYLGAVDRGSFGGDVSDDAPVGPFAMPLVPTALATATAGEAFAALDRADAKRLVVLDGDRLTYVGLVCMRCDREHLCVDAALVAGAR